MNLFVRKHEKKINATLGCFDRMLFRGYLPIQSGWAMSQFLKQKDIRSANLKDFLSDNAGRINDYAKTMATKLGRPFQYLTAPTRKEDLARKMAEKEGIEHGLVCIFSVLEPCRSFAFKFKTGFPYVQSARRKCLFLYFYFMDRDFGLIHVKLQTWFPMQIQVYVNGHEWLARKLIANRISFSKHDNVFVRVDDWGRAQKFADRFTGLNWPWILERYARSVNPLLKDLLRGYQHYWVTSQSEYSTDIIFKSSSDLRELFPRLLSHSTLCFGAKEVMSFLGRKLHGKFGGEIISDMNARCQRIPGARIKHRVKENWLKMYDKAGSILRVEMVVNNPEEFKVRKKVARKGKQVLEWVPMRKGVAYLFRYQEVSQQANQRYLDALAVVDDPTPAIQQLDDITTRKETKSGRGVRAFNPLSRDDIQLFKAMMAGEHHIRGLSNADIRTCLENTLHLRDLADNPKKQSAKVSRILCRFHAHKLIAKIPRTRRWRVTDRGKQIMAASLCLRDVAFPELFRKNAAA
jgi:5'(3')-deoxyribonucleotidase